MNTDLDLNPDRPDSSANNIDIDGSLNEDSVINYDNVNGSNFKETLKCFNISPMEDLNASVYFNQTPGYFNIACRDIYDNSSLSLTDTFNDTNDTLKDHSPLSTSSRAILATTLCALYLVIFIVNFGLIWYESILSDNYSTLLDKLVSLASAYRICSASKAALMIFARLVFVDKFNLLYCQFTFYTTQLFMVQLLFVYAETIYVQYYYSCRLGYLGTLNEDILFRVIIIVNFIVGSFLSFFWLAGAGKTNIYFQFCQGSSTLVQPGNIL